MENVSEKLVYKLQTEAETEISFTVPDTDPNVTSEDASNAIDEIIALNVLMDDAGNAAAVAMECERVRTTTTQLF